MSSHETYRDTLTFHASDIAPMTMTQRTSPRAIVSADAMDALERLCTGANLHLHSDVDADTTAAPSDLPTARQLPDIAEPA